MILVTGGAGFIGSHIVDALVDAGSGGPGVDSLLRSPTRTRPDYLNPAPSSYRGPEGSGA